MRYVIAVLVGILIGFLIWGLEPDYIKNVKDSEPGETFILVKHGLAGREQVAVIHGMLDDRLACTTMADAMTEGGGTWVCYPADR